MKPIRAATILCFAFSLLACAAHPPSSEFVASTSAMELWVKEVSGGLLPSVKGSVVDPDCANQKVDYETQQLALDAKDRTPALVITKSGSTCLGRTGQKSELWVKSGGQWVSQFVVSEGEIQTLPSRSQGFADLSVRGGSCSPLWRWQGQRYVVVKRCP